MTLSEISALLRWVDELAYETRLTLVDITPENVHTVCEPSHLLEMTPGTIWENGRGSWTGITVLVVGLTPAFFETTVAPRLRATRHNVHWCSSDVFFLRLLFDQPKRGDKLEILTGILTGVFAEEVVKLFRREVNNAPRNSK